MARPTGKTKSAPPGIAPPFAKSEAMNQHMDANLLSDPIPNQTRLAVELN
jgi:hypothetical protein